jgi:hypothetical protein
VTFQYSSSLLHSLASLVAWFSRYWPFDWFLMHQDDFPLTWVNCQISWSLQSSASCEALLVLNSLFDRFCRQL